MKYIMISDGFGTYPVIFDNSMSHLYISNSLEGTIKSAGFVALVDGKVECYGESITLGIAMGPDDAKIIEEGLDP